MVSAFASFKFGVAFCFTQLISVLMVFYVSITITTTPTSVHQFEYNFAIYIQYHLNKLEQKTTI